MDHQGQVGMHSRGLLRVANDEVEMCALDPGGDLEVGLANCLGLA